VKFCPLSPCKGNRTPIFQLDKHLQTPLHHLSPNIPRYRQEFNKAPRVSLEHLEAYFKEQKEKRNRVKEEKRKKRDQRSGGEERQDVFDESEEEARPQEESEREMEERTATVDVDSDQEYEELATRV